MGFVARFLSSYSESFTMAVAVWPLASFVLTLPILAYLYHRDGRILPLSAMTAYLAVLYLMGLACFTLYPLPEGDAGPGITYGLAPILNPLHFVGDIQTDGIAAVAQLAANMALFVPFGFIAGRGLRLGPVPSVLLGLATSLCIELAQLTGLFGLYPYAYRTFETTDLCTNTLGALAGWTLARLSLRLLPARAGNEGAPVTASPGIVRRTVAFSIDMTLSGTVALVAGSAGTIALYALGLETAPAVGAGLYGMLCTVGVVVTELVVPWHTGGRTPGGAFVRMTCETRERHGGRRAAFYAARLLAILCTTGLASVEPRLGIVPLVCMVFYAFARKMPYDLI